jgi:hypothetical protein
MGLAKLKVRKGSLSRIETGGVMRIGGIEKAAQDAAAEPGRALVPLAPPAPPGAPAHYRQAPFLAHLLAVKDQHAQTRERRRAAPAEAIAAYRATAALTTKL